jgi:hypothetical protein
MSTRVYRDCDRCSGPCGPDRLELSIEAGTTHGRREGEALDLCTQCASELGRWFRVANLARPPLRARASG